MKNVQKKIFIVLLFPSYTLFITQSNPFWHDPRGSRAHFELPCGRIRVNKLHTLCKGFAQLVQIPCTISANVLHYPCNTAALFLCHLTFERSA